MSLIGPPTVCQGESIQVQFTFVGQAPFIAQIAIDGVLQEPILSETNSTIIEVPVTQSGLVTFVRFDDRSCGGNPNGAFPVTVLLPGETTINMSICEGDTAEVAGNKITFPGNYVFTLTDAASNGCDSIITLNLEVNENERTNLELQICEGESVTIGPNEYSETGVYSDTLETVHGCDSIVNLDLLVTNEIVVSTNRVICAGSSIEFGGETLFEDGTYYDTIAISATCDSIYILDLHVLNVIVLIQTVIEPDTGQSSGSIMIQVAGGIPPYSYLWSNGDTTNHPMNLDVGSYSLTITDALGCIAEYNFFLISATEDLLPGFEQIVVYPNPVCENGDLNLAITRQTSDVQQITLQVQNLWGQVFYKQEALLSGEETLVQISKGKLLPGIYLIQLRDEKSVAIVRRFLVQ
jgi:hypothetical protein